MRKSLTIAIGTMALLAGTASLMAPAPASVAPGSVKTLGATPNAPRSQLAAQSRASKLEQADPQVVNPALHALFEARLDVVPGESPELAHATLERELEQRFVPGAANAARALLVRYEEYRRDLADIEKGLQLSGADATVRANQVGQLRARYFSASESENLFGAAPPIGETPDWQFRIAAYLEERNRLVYNEPELSDVARQAALLNLRQSRFNPAELALLVAHE